MGAGVASVAAHLQQGLHHAAGDQGLAPGVVAGQVVEEGEQGRGKLVRVGLHQGVWGRGKQGGKNVTFHLGSRK